MRRPLTAPLGAMAALAGLLASSLVARPSPAAFEGGLQVGAIRRDLSGTRHSTLFNAQVYAAFAVLPKYLWVGLYMNGVPTGATSSPDRSNAPDVSFRTYGARARASLPVTTRLSVYAHAGIGYVDADFPEVIYLPCAGCARRIVASESRSFVEFPVGVGIRYLLEGPFLVTLEGAYRPTSGYEHDKYDRAYHRVGDPPQTRSADAWSFLAGLGFLL